MKEYNISLKELLLFAIKISIISSVTTFVIVDTMRIMGWCF